MDLCRPAFGQAWGFCYSIRLKLGKKMMKSG